MKISSEKIEIDEKVTISIDVKNVGEVDGEETVQLYVSDIQSSITRPKLELKGFKKQFIKAGETVNVSFEVNTKMFEFTGFDYTPIVEKGIFEISIGKNSKDLYTTRLELV